MTQVPVPTTETDDPDTVQTPALAGAAANTTARPDVAEAATVYPSPGSADAGGVDVKLIVCGLSAAGATANDCSACGAGW